MGNAVSPIPPTRACWVIVSPPPTMCGQTMPVPTSAPINKTLNLRSPTAQTVNQRTGSDDQPVVCNSCKPSRRRIPSTAKIGPVQKLGVGRVATWKSGCCPSNSDATAMAEQEAPSAAMVIRISNRRTSSSSTNTAPAIGELNATASPAPAPAAKRARRSVVGSRKIFPQNSARLAPICTTGSFPSEC